MSRPKEISRQNWVVLWIGWAWAFVSGWVIFPHQNIAEFDWISRVRLWWVYRP